MDNDLISREALKDKLQARYDNGEEEFDKGYNIGIETAIDLIDNAPTVDTACPHCDSGYAQGYSDGYLKGKDERPQGEWIFEKANEEHTDGYICSNCKCSFHTKVPYFSEFNFCPNCGAKMKGGAE